MGSSSATMTKVRVQTQQGQPIGLNQVRYIKLPDGWHPVNDCQLTYRDAQGQTKAVAFADIQGFSDQEESNT